MIDELICFVVPVRGGSKGIPGKNLRSVGGSPLLARCLRAIPHSDLENFEVLVSTDDQNLMRIATNHNAHVIHRPEELSGDNASSESAIIHALRTRYGQDAESTPDVTVFLQATSPFISTAHIMNAIHKVTSGEYDVCFSAYETFTFLWGQDEHNGAFGINHDPRTRPRRQDREPHYIETGAFYVMRTSGFLEAKHRFFGRIGVEVVSEHSAIEIDTPEDLAIARHLAVMLDENPHSVDVDALVMDFDGVHTPNTAIVSEDGNESVIVNRSDGMGIQMLKRSGKALLILSKEQNPVVSSRAAKLGVECMQGIDDKLTSLKEWATSKHIDLNRIAYVGNDINDLTCMEHVGWPIAVADAEPEVLEAARVRLSAKGGNGAIREISKLILNGGQ